MFEEHTSTYINPNRCPRLIKTKIVGVPVLRKFHELHLEATSLTEILNRNIVKVTVAFIVSMWFVTEILKRNSYSISYSRYKLYNQSVYY